MIKSFNPALAGISGCFARKKEDHFCLFTKLSSGSNASYNLYFFTKITFIDLRYNLEYFERLNN